MSFIFNPLGRLPSIAEAQAQFKRAGLVLASFQDRAEGAMSYPAVEGMSSDGRVFRCDMLHGGGSMWEEC